MALVVTSAEAPAPLLPFASPDGGASAVAAACRVRGTPEAHLQFSCRNREATQARAPRRMSPSCSAP